MFYCFRLNTFPLFLKISNKTSCLLLPLIFNIALVLDRANMQKMKLKESRLERGRRTMQSVVYRWFLIKMPFPFLIDSQPIMKLELLVLLG